MPCNRIVDRLRRYQNLGAPLALSLALLSDDDHFLYLRLAPSGISARTVMIAPA